MRPNIDQVRRGRWADHPELLWERSQLGVIRAATLESLGVPSRTVYRRCLPGGPWQRLLPGTILLQNGPPTRNQLAVAAQLYAGPYAQITGLEACSRHGLRLDGLGSEQIHLLIPHEHRLQSAEFVTVERTDHLPRPVGRQGMALAPLIRATTDAARRIRETEPVAHLLIEAIQNGRCSPEALHRELEAGSQRGTAIPRRVLERVEHLRSVAELHARGVGDRLAVPPSHWNEELFGPDGSYIGCPDGWWHAVCLAWEIDSIDFHFRIADYARTLRRNNRYTSKGIVFVQTLPSQLLEDPAGVIAELEDAYQRAMERPRPPISLRLDSAA